MNQQPSNLTEFIVAEVQRQTSEDSIKQLVEKKIGSIIADAVEHSMRSYGNVGEQIKNAVAASLDINGKLDVPAYGHMVMGLLRSKMDETLSSLVNERLSVELDEILQIAPKELKFSAIVKQVLDSLDAHDGYGRSITCIIEKSYLVDGYYHIYLDTDEDVRKSECEASIAICSEGKIYSLTIDRKDASKTIIMGSIYGWKKTLFAAYCSGSKIIMDDLDPSTTIGDY